MIVLFFWFLKEHYIKMENGLSSGLLLDSMLVKWRDDC